MSTFAVVLGIVAAGIMAGVRSRITLYPQQSPNEALCQYKMAPRE